MYSTDTDISSGWLGGCWVGLSGMLVIVETDQFCLFNYGIELIYLENWQGRLRHDSEKDLKTREINGVSYHPPPPTITLLHCFSASLDPPLSPRFFPSISISCNFSNMLTCSLNQLITFCNFSNMLSQHCWRDLKKNDSLLQWNSSGSIYDLMMINSDYSSGRNGIVKSLDLNCV